MTCSDKQHDRSVKRYNDYKHIKRKENIIKNTYGKIALEDKRCMHRLMNHRLSDNKIHRSDEILKHKTNTNGLKYSDAKKIINDDDLDVNIFFNEE